MGGVIDRLIHRSLHETERLNEDRMLAMAHNLQRDKLQITRIIVQQHVLPNSILFSNRNLNSLQHIPRLYPIN